MSGYKEIARRDSCFRPGSTLCPGCMESIALNNVGRVTANGVKTVFTIGTSCAEVSSLAFPNIVSWGRGDGPPDDFAEIARHEAIKGKTWNHPVLVGGVLLVRNSQEMAAFRLPLAAR